MPQNEVHRMYMRNGKILEEENRELNFLLQQHLAPEDARNMHGQWI
ncbi:hypothetical protein Lalb_Chr08g0241071 [Lupinus albus]|uniref:Uncharacterized protein n=1 Tax=Lupinus albus TaxID=3870 RepID=A0A6A4Q518_LUPAL|nr:hypothetical protein Lalb_Chr08g0241071 [Lupinus albus]